MEGRVMRGNDLTIYTRFADQWWEPRAAPFRSLQNLTPFRIEMIRELCGSLEGKTVFDLGCGGGLISLPLLDSGSNVIGIDQSAKSIEVARAKANGRGTFLAGDIRDVRFPDQSADIVLLADVLDHLPDYPRALAEASRLVRRGGRVFCGTINRTVQALFGAIVLGEGLRLIPRGTHQYRLFVRPDELQAAAEQTGLRFLRCQGERVRLIETIRRWAITLERGRSVKLAYSMVFERP
jgi:2-polyprenyl-6-hydroxyphenyl methylase / 3-demethylubiquinone-9 3-methyltransferase